MRQRRAQSVLVGCVVAALSLGGALAGGAATADPDQRPATVTVDRVKKPKSLVQFLSKDGTAEVGTTTTFTLTSLATGAALRIPVVGEGPRTSYSQVVKPGKYTVTSEPSILNGATFMVSTLSPESGLITVKKPKKGSKKNAVTKVTFSLAKSAPDTALLLESATVGQVSLAWSGPEGATYSLRRTEGYAPAADDSGGEAVALASPTATSTVDSTVAEATTYTYTLFGSAGGAPMGASSISLSTPSSSGDQPAFAVAPDTIIPDSLAELAAEPLTASTVAVTIGSATTRASRTGARPDVAGRWVARRASSGCVVGAPFLLSTDAAGEDAFYGVVESCEGGSGAARRREGERAVVNTEVPLSSVLSFLEISYEADECVTDEESTTDTTCQDAKDTDGDGLPDPNERDFGSNPTKPDTDGDDLTDGQEVLRHGTDPLRQDTDRDDFFDPEEVEEGTDPATLDTDADGLLDAEEVYNSETDPRTPDTDGDGFSDTREVEEGSNPTNEKSVPTRGRVDTDGDGLTDPREEVNGADPSLPDTDGDGLDDFLEVTVWATYPDDEDSDFDGVTDGAEVAAGTQPMEDESMVIPPFVGRTSAAAEARRSCVGAGSTTFDPRAGFNKEERFKVTLKGVGFTYDIAYVATPYANPVVKANGGVSCSFSLGSGDIPLQSAPLPITLNFGAVVNAGASGSFSMNGPNVSASVGFRGKGSVEVVKRCGGPFNLVCYPVVQQSQNLQPVNTLTYRDPAVRMNGTASFLASVSIGVKVGYDNRFAKAKAGFSGTLVPFSATLKRLDGPFLNCVRYVQEASAALDFSADVWAVDPRFGLSTTRRVFSGTFPQKDTYLGYC